MVFPRVVVGAQAVKRVRNYDCWVFRDELGRADSGAGPGDVVELVDHRGGFVAYAFFNAQAHIALRAISLAKDEPPNAALWRDRLARALAKRRRLSGTNARRLVHSEADGLPGLIVDQYADCLVVQFRSAGMDRLRAAIVALLREALEPRGVLERSDKEFRREEGLEPVVQLLHGTVPERIPIEEDGARFLVDPHRGLKTGFYLDQRPTRRRLRQHIEPGQQVLDVFSYTGSLGITAAMRGARVTCVEQQEEFLALAREHAALNGVQERMRFVAADAFYWLDVKAEVGERFDWVLLDPPALAKAKTALPRARQALHYLLVHALGLVAPGGHLLLSLCTYHLLGLAEEIIRIAAAERRVRLWVQDCWPQAEDHPWMLQQPPSRYLMSWWLSHDGQSSFDSLTLAHLVPTSVGARQDDREQAKRVERSAA